MFTVTISVSLSLFSLYLDLFLDYGTCLYVLGLLGGLIGGVIGGVFILFVVAVLVAICFCMMLNYKATKGRVINTLGIIGERVKRARRYATVFT